LRHTGGSLAYGKEPTKVVSERLGHSRTAITEDLYIHTNIVQHQKLAETIGNLLAI
jgi:integrase